MKLYLSDLFYYEMHRGPLPKSPIFCPRNPTPTHLLFLNFTRPSTRHAHASSPNSTVPIQTHTYKTTVRPVSDSVNNSKVITLFFFFF